MVFWLYPLIFSGYISLTNYNSLTGENTFIGTQNFVAMFSDSLFFKALANTSLFTFITVPITVSLALFFANLLNGKVWFKNFFRASFFVPSVTSVVVISLIFTNLYAIDGYANVILKYLGLPIVRSGWLLNKNTSLPAIMLMDIWASFGYYMVIFLAAMQTIPNSIYESTILNGASKWLVFRKITLPMLKPTIAFVLVINVIKSFQIFTEIFVMTKGGPQNSTTTLLYMIYQNAFEQINAVGYASAISFFLLAILLLFSFIQLKLLKDR